MSDTQQHVRVTLTGSPLYERTQPDGQVAYDMRAILDNGERLTIRLQKTTIESMREDIASGAFDTRAAAIVSGNYVTDTQGETHFCAESIGNDATV